MVESAKLLTILVGALVEEENILGFYRWLLKKKYFLCKDGPMFKMVF